VVIEGTDFTIDLSPPTWQPTAEDEHQRLAEAHAAWRGFLDRLDVRVEHHQRGAKDPEEDWDELDYERFFRISDARSDKYSELLEKYGHSEEVHKKFDGKMGWNRELPEEEAEEEQRRVDEINAACEAARAARCGRCRISANGLAQSRETDQGMRVTGQWGRIHIIDNSSAPRPSPTECDDLPRTRFSIIWIRPHCVVFVSHLGHQICGGTEDLRSKSLLC
jgi:hypothetical protein